MADKVRYAVSATPVEEVTLTVTYTNEEQTDVLPADLADSAYEVLSTEVNTSLGGSGEAAVASYGGSAAVQGYASKAANYRMAIDSANNIAISTESTASFVFIKNTGKVAASDNVAELGDTLDKAVKVMVGTTPISVLDTGEAIVLKDDNATIDCSGINVRTVDLDGSDNTSAGHLAVEFLVVD